MTDTVCETFDGQPVPPESVRRIACDAVIIPIVVDGAGVVLNHGHGRRMASVEQRRALRAMYRSCGFPDCTVRFGDCEVHHVIAVGAPPRADQPRQPAALCSPAPPPRARGWLAPRVVPRPAPHRAPPRRHRHVRRVDRRCRRRAGARGSPDPHLATRPAGAAAGRRQRSPPAPSRDAVGGCCAASETVIAVLASECLVRLASAFATRIPPPTRPPPADGDPSTDCRLPPHQPLGCAPLPCSHCFRSSSPTGHHRLGLADATGGLADGSSSRAP